MQLKARRRCANQISSCRLALCRFNYLWSRPVTPLASIWDGLTDVLGPDLLVGADLSTDPTQRRDVIGGQRPHWTRALAVNAGNEPPPWNDHQRSEDQRFRASIRTPVDLDGTPLFAANRFRRHLSRSTGRRTPSGPRLNTCVCTIVVLTYACPSSSCTVLMS
jgi:hypothetical protein